MRFRDLAAEYERLEGTTKRLEMRAILVALLRQLTPAEIPEVLYLSQGLLRPEYEGVELGMAGSLASKAVASVTRADEAEVARRLTHLGDLGSVAAEMLGQGGHAPVPPPLEVPQVYDGLLGIARATGEGSQDAKVQALVRLLERAGPTEAKYIVRFVLGMLRLGVREMTILDALAEAYGNGTKAARARIEAAFNVSSDLGLVAQRLAERGLEGLDEIHLTVGRPIRPMLAERSPDLNDVLERMGGRTALEYKYDGLRVQAHIPSQGPVRLFSRRLEDISGQFPELVAELPKAVKRTPAIIEGECVPIDLATDEIRPFQEVSRRRGRKYDLERMQEEVPVCLFVFDALLDGKDELLDHDFPDRRERLQSMLRATDRVRLAQQRVVEDVGSAQEFFDTAIADGGEGVMAKSISPGSGYHPGGRGFWWIKYKREYTAGLADSIDGVVVGAFHGRGRRAGTYGALLMAVYNPKADRFESFCKVGSGFDDEELKALPARLKHLEADHRPEGVLTELEPDRWFQPKLVLEIKGAELTLSPIHRAGVGVLRPNAGLALRFPRFTGRYREDKSATDATTTEELLEMYRMQVKQSTAPTDDTAAA